MPVSAGRGCVRGWWFGQAVSDPACLSYLLQRCGPVLSADLPARLAAVVDRYRQKIERLEPQVDAVFRLEREERELRTSEAQLSWAQRQLETPEQRPRTWFQSQQQRARAKGRQLRTTCAYLWHIRPGLHLPQEHSTEVSASRITQHWVL